MYQFACFYVQAIERVNHLIGRCVTYGIFIMLAILLWSSISKTFFVPSLWTLEMAQFAMVAYYILGGPYALQMNANVRMDVFYERLSKRNQLIIDSITIFFLIFYLCVLFYGAIDSTIYALQYNERSATAWRPYLYPIKIIMVIGIVLMLLQCLALFIKDIAKLYGKEISCHTK